MTVLLANGLALVTVMLRVITDDGSADGTNFMITKLKEGSPMDDGFVQLRLTVSEPMFITLRFVGSLGGAEVKIIIIIELVATIIIDAYTILAVAHCC